MKRLAVILPFVLLILPLGGCDVFRRIAGRPTSADIEAKRELIETEQEEHRRRLDSAAAVRQKIADSLAIMDSLSRMKDTVIESRELSEESRLALSSRYYVVIGAFGNPANARKHASRAEENGYPAVLIRYRNGFTAVGICPSDSISEAFRSMKSVREDGFCPDAWILDNRP